MPGRGVRSMSRPGVQGHFWGDQFPGLAGVAVTVTDRRLAGEMTQTPPSKSAKSSWVPQAQAQRTHAREMSEGDG